MNIHCYNQLQPPAPEIIYTAEKTCPELCPEEFEGPVEEAARSPAKLTPEVILCLGSDDSGESDEGNEVR